MSNDEAVRRIFYQLAADNFEFARPLYHSDSLTKQKMGLIVDGIKYRIQKRNAERVAYQTAIANIIPDVIASIITEYYFGTMCSIPETAADRSIYSLLVVHKRHSLAIEYCDSTNTLICLRYNRQCSPMIECYNQHLFELSDYIEFILTGYNSEIFDEFFELIWDCSADDVNEYKPCCADGDARPLSEQLLNKLRSRILSNA